MMIKPDGVKRGLIGEVIARIERRGLKIIALHMYQPSKDEMDNHYPKDPAWIHRLGEKTLSTYAKYGFDAVKELGTDKKEEIGPMIREWLISYMTSAPVVKIVVEGVHAVDTLRKMVGNTMPALAELGTLRGDFSVDSAAAANKEKRAVHNLVHVSETPEEAQHEINHWFAKNDIHSYSRTEESLML